MIRALLAALAALLLLPAAAHALPADFEEITLAEGLSQPTAVAFAPASDGRMFIAEQPGRVRVRLADGTLRATPLLDWRDRVNSAVDRGLLGIATDTDFADNGYLYVLFVADSDSTDDTGPHSSRLVRLTVSADNQITGEKTLAGGESDQGECFPNDAFVPAGDVPDGKHDTAGDAAVDCIPASAKTHTIGTVISDPRDGSIWFGTGDAQTVDLGNVGARPRRLRTYNEETYYGKILRVDREGRGLAGHPFCPAVEDLDRTCTKLYAKGFRNPFRFTLPPQDGARPIIADVGHATYEELGRVRPGANAGWPCWEGFEVGPNPYSTYADCSRYGTSVVDFPDFAYKHATPSGGKADAAILAGPVYDGGEYPAEYAGNLFFGDYARGFIRRFRPGSSPGTFLMTPPLIEHFGEANSSVLFTERPAFTQLTEAPNGDLVVVDFVTAGPNEDYSGPGRVVRIAHAPANRAPTAVAKVEQEEIAGGATARFDGSDSSDPNTDTLTYAWDFDGDGTTDSTEVAPTRTYPAAGVFTARLTVDDGRGRSATDSVQVLVDRHRPRVQIDAPVADEVYDGGVSMRLAGDATDADEAGGFPEANLRWEIRLIHGSHMHPYTDIAGLREADFVPLQDHGLDSSYRIRLVATDSHGVEGSASVTVLPRPATLRVESQPEGAPIEVEEQMYVAPRNVASASGLNARVRAAADFTRDGVTWRFARWTDGETARDRSHLVGRDGGTVVAVYEQEPVRGGSGAGTAPDPGAAGGTGSTEPTTPPKGATPKLSLTTPWTARRRSTRTVSGTLTGVTARPTVQVALARSSGTRCRWWSARTRRFGRTATCRTPVWTTARVQRTSAGWRFDAALRSAVARRAGRIQARARVGGRTVAQVTVRVSDAR
ncbi:MAG: PQQ-dependent sugar dehydrogenase [Solirubrobacteraceae bacterium]